MRSFSQRFYNNSAFFNHRHEANIKAIKRNKLKHERIDLLNQEAVTAKLNYEVTVRGNLVVETKLRDRKMKAHQKLQTIIQKFDNDVGARFQQIEDIEKALKTGKKDLQKWKLTTCADLNSLYDELMEEKNEQERLDIEMSLLRIRHEHAAKVIQRHFREILQKRKIKTQRKRSKMFQIQVCSKSSVNLI